MIHCRGSDSVNKTKQKILAYIGPIYYSTGVKSFKLRGRMSQGRTSKGANKQGGESSKVRGESARERASQEAIQPGTGGESARGKSDRWRKTQEAKEPRARGQISQGAKSHNLADLISRDFVGRPQDIYVSSVLYICIRT